MKEQPPPKANDSVPTWELVIADMRERDRVGRERYGTPLQPNNGRNSLEDAYAEVLDQAVYLKNAIVEGQKDSTCLDALENLMRHGFGPNVSALVRGGMSIRAAVGKLAVVR